MYINRNLNSFLNSTDSFENWGSTAPMLLLLMARSWFWYQCSQRLFLMCAGYRLRGTWMSLRASFWCLGRGSRPSLLWNWSWECCRSGRRSGDWWVLQMLLGSCVCLWCYELLLYDQRPHRNQDMKIVKILKQLHRHVRWFRRRSGCLNAENQPFIRTNQFDFIIRFDTE